MLSTSDPNGERSAVPATSGTGRRSRWRTSARVGVAAVVLVATAACSGDGDGDGDVGVADPAGDAGGRSTEATGPGADPGDTGAESGGTEDSTNPVVFGYAVDGPPGTTVVVVSTLVAGDIEQPAITATWSITDRPREQLYTPFVDSGELDLEVTEGGPATVTVITARYVDPDDPFAGIEVVERLGSVEVGQGSTAALGFP